MSDFERVGPRNRIENIEVDESQVIENLCEAIKELPPEQQLVAVQEFLQHNLLNALKPKVQIPKDVEARIWDQRTVKALTTVLDDRYGVCLDWHVVGQAILNKLGIETIFQIGQVPGGAAHTYLDVNVNGKWQVFDPFADQYLKDRGYDGGLFQQGYYLNSKAYRR